MFVHNNFAKIQDFPGGVGTLVHTTGPNKNKHQVSTECKEINQVTHCIPVLLALWSGLKSIRLEKAFFCAASTPSTLFLLPWAGNVKDATEGCIGLAGAGRRGGGGLLGTDAILTGGVADVYHDDWPTTSAMPFSVVPVGRSEVSF